MLHGRLSHSPCICRPSLAVSSGTEPWQLWKVLHYLSFSAQINCDCYPHLLLLTMPTHWDYHSQRCHTFPIVAAAVCFTLSFIISCCRHIGVLSTGYSTNNLVSCSVVYFVEFTCLKMKNHRGRFRSPEEIPLTTVRTMSGDSEGTDEDSSPRHTATPPNKDKKWRWSSR